MDLIMRRALMMAQKKDVGYITDGLTHWWDGINKGGVTGVWKDLVGNIDLYAQGSVSESQKGWALSGGWLQSDEGYYIAEEYGTATIEMVFRVDSISSGRTVYLFVSGPNTTEKPILAIDTNARIINSNKSNKYVYLLDGNYKGHPKRVSNTQNLCVINGALATRGSTSYKNNNNDYTYVGKRSPDYTDCSAFRGEVYSVRVYNRKLTSDEMMYNQSVDERIFGLWE